MFLLACRHGLRASEVGLLRAEDLDLKTLRLMVHRLKGSHSGAHPLQPDEAKAVRAWLLWANRLTARDRHALTPLFWEHVNLYGRQELDMRTRIAALA